MLEKKSLKNTILAVLVAAALMSLSPSIVFSERNGNNTWENEDRENLGMWSIVATYPIPEGASGLAYDGTYLYCGIYGANGDEVYQIDPNTGSYVLQFTGPQGDAFGLTYDGAYLWTTDHPGSSSIPAIAMQLDMDGNLISQFNLPAHYMSGIAYDAGDFWVATYYPDPATIYKVNETGSIITQFTAPDNQPWDLCLENDYLWMADYWGDALYKINKSTGSLIEAHASEYTDPAGIVWDGAYLWYCDEGAGGNDYLYKVDLGGAGTPEINVPITSHDYGIVTVGDSVTWNATAQNVGTADLVINNVTFTGTGSNDLSCPLTFPITITPGNQTQLPLVYVPLDIGELNAIATIESNDPIHPTVDITLTGNAVSSGPDIYLPESSYDYGSVRINSYTRWLMGIQNIGDESLTINDITSDDSHFIVDDQVTFPFDIDTLSSVQIGIWFQPEAAIGYSGTISIFSNDPDENPYNASVQGTGLDMDYPIGETLWNYVIDTSWDNSPKAIAPISDINGDGISDVIICSEDDYIRCFNGNAHAIGDVLWEHEIYAGSVYSQNDLTINEDVDGDGYDDVVVGSAWGGRLIRTISGKTGEEIWTHDTHEYGGGGWVYQVDCSYDYNGDGVTDVLASTGDDGSATGPMRVYCLDGLTGISIWECPLGAAGFAVIGVEDFTGDGLADVVAGADPGCAYGINGATGSITWTFTAAGSSVWALEQIDDITNDGIKDVIIGDFYGNIYGLDATTGGLEYSNSVGSYVIITRFAKLNDVNGDGHPDIVPAHSGIHVTQVIDGQTGSFIWSHPVADQPWNVARIADISGDGIDDVLVGTLFNNNYCYFLSGTDGSELASINLGTPVDAIAAIPDIVGDGSMEMVAGGRNGYVACFSGGIMNQPPDEPTNPSPADGAPGIDINPMLSVDVTDPDGDSMDVSFYDASDGLIGIDTGIASGGTASTTWPGLAYSTTYSWYAIANDSELQNQSDTWSFTTKSAPDTTPPVTTHSLTGTMGSNGWYTSNVKVTLTATDDMSGVAYTKYRIDGGSWNTYTTSFTLTTEGMHTVSYYSVDNVGNVESTKSVSFKIDKTDPATTHALDPATPDGDNGWYVSNVEVTLTATDSTSGIMKTEYRIDGGSWNTYTTPLTISTDGTHTVEYNSTDNAGNVESTKSVSFKIDKTKPTVSIDRPKGYLYFFDRQIISLPKTIIIGPITIEADATDTTSGIDKVEFYIDGVLKNTDNVAPYEWKWDETAFFKHTIKVIAYDKAGNAATPDEIEVTIFNF